MEIEVIKKNFDEIRRDKGLRIEDICADLGGISRQALYNYMKGGMSLNTLARIAAALGVDPWELLKPVDDDNNEQNKLPQIICPHCGKAITISVKEN